jgi:NAD(P)H-quinone oxidoreductase subunit 5
MQSMLAVWVAAGPAALWAVGMIPSGWANRRAVAMRRLVTGAAVGAFAAASASAVGLALVGPVHASPLGPLGAAVYYDSLSAVMMLLISFIGCIIARFAVRQLDGEATQGRFMRWISFTLGSVLTLTFAGNLAMFFAAWVLTSFGLHQLLTHYKDRPGAILAARKKFLISRIGDVLLAAGVLLTLHSFGSLQFDEVFAAAERLHAGPSQTPWTTSLIGLLFVLGAMTKSAQFPMHSWLPETMETPTAVSALMHAGVINAGGFLVIRLSPLVTLSTVALDFLAVVGTFTALFAATTALTQTSVKRSLAYSTIAQMGFMMLQCGLGAFSAALLHIAAHSLYKAHAFLRSGSVLEQASRRNVGRRPAGGARWELASLAISLPAAAFLCAAIGWGFGATTMSKPGALVLGVIMTLALAQLLCSAIQWGGLRAGRRPTWDSIGCFKIPYRTASSCIRALMRR